MSTVHTHPNLSRMQELEGELHDERHAHQLDSKRVQELSAVAEQLQYVKAELEQESATLKTDKVQLLQRTEALVQQQAELRQTSDVLRTENTTLSQQVCFAGVRCWLQTSGCLIDVCLPFQVSTLKIVNQEAVKSFAEHLQRVKIRVVESFEQFSQGILDSNALLDTLKDLGMEVNFSAESLDALPDIAGRPGLK